MPHECHTNATLAPRWRCAELEGMMDEVKMTVRLPVDVAEYLKDQARRNFTSRNAEVIRAVRERMGVAETARVGAISTPSRASGG